METYLLPIVLSILGGSSITAWVTWQVSKRKQPYEDLSAKTDASTQLVASALAITSKLEEQVKILEDNDHNKEIRLEKMELESKTQASLIQRLTARIELWVTWAEEIRINWAFIRLDEDPPTPPDMYEDKEDI